MRKTRGKGPQFIRFFSAIIEVLKELGGSGTPAEVSDLVIERMGIPEGEQEETLLKSGVPRVRNQIRWARLYLVRAGFLGASQRGVWKLTEKGLKANLSQTDVYDTFKAVQKFFSEDKKKKAQESSEEASDPGDNQEPEGLDHRASLLALLKSLSPEGFERICQRVLRESGFQQVNVTGRSGDGGIDGNGVLEVNPFVSFNVLFQCKRYQGSVTPSQVRDFRGAMLGRADKGLILTTGSFTLEAKKEARRDGAPPIELVDGDKLAEMFERLNLGLKPRQTYEIDEEFFAEFK
jgi:restriction system protein